MKQIEKIQFISLTTAMMLLVGAQTMFQPVSQERDQRRGSNEEDDVLGVSCGHGDGLSHGGHAAGAARARRNTADGRAGCDDAGRGVRRDRSGHAGCRDDDARVRCRAVARCDGAGASGFGRDACARRDRSGHARRKRARCRAARGAGCERARCKCVGRGSASGAGRNITATARRDLSGLRQRYGLLRRLQLDERFVFRRRVRLRVDRLRGDADPPERIGPELCVLGRIRQRRTRACAGIVRARRSGRRFGRRTLEGSSGQRLLRHLLFQWRQSCLSGPADRMERGDWHPSSRPVRRREQGNVRRPPLGVVGLAGGRE